MEIYLKNNYCPYAAMYLDSSVWPCKLTINAHYIQKDFMFIL